MLNDAFKLTIDKIFKIKKENSVPEPYPVTGYADN